MERNIGVMFSVYPAGWDVRRVDKPYPRWTDRDEECTATLSDGEAPNEADAWCMSNGCDGPNLPSNDAEGPGYHTPSNSVSGLSGGVADEEVSFTDPSADPAWAH